MGDTRCLGLPAPLTPLHARAARCLVSVTLPNTLNTRPGAEFVAKDLGMKVDATVVEQLGVARKVRRVQGWLRSSLCVVCVVLSFVLCCHAVVVGVVVAVQQLAMARKVRRARWVWLAPLLALY